MEPRVRWWNLTRGFVTKSFLYEAKKGVNASLLYYAYLTLFWTGVREAELLGVRKRDLDLRNGIVYVKEAYHKVDDEVDNGLKNDERDVSSLVPRSLFISPPIE